MLESQALHKARRLSLKERKKHTDSLQTCLKVDPPTLIHLTHESQLTQEGFGISQVMRLLKKDNHNDSTSSQLQAISAQNSIARRKDSIYNAYLDYHNNRCQEIKVDDQSLNPLDGFKTILGDPTGNNFISPVRQYKPIKMMNISLTNKKGMQKQFPFQTVKSNTKSKFTRSKASIAQEYGIEIKDSVIFNNERIQNHRSKTNIHKDVLQTPIAAAPSPLIQLNQKQLYIKRLRKMQKLVNLSAEELDQTSPYNVAQASPAVDDQNVYKTPTALSKKPGKIDEMVLSYSNLLSQMNLHQKLKDSSSMNFQIVGQNLPCQFTKTPAVAQKPQMGSSPSVQNNNYSSFVLQLQQRRQSCDVVDSDTSIMLVPSTSNFDQCLSELKRKQASSKFASRQPMTLARAEFDSYEEIGEAGGELYTPFASLVDKHMIKQDRLKKVIITNFDKQRHLLEGKFCTNIKRAPRNLMCLSEETVKAQRLKNQAGVMLKREKFDNYKLLINMANFDAVTDLQEIRNVAMRRLESINPSPLKRRLL